MVWICFSWCQFHKSHWILQWTKCKRRFIFLQRQTGLIANLFQYLRPAHFCVKRCDHSCDGDVNGRKSSQLGCCIMQFGARLPISSSLTIMFKSLSLHISAQNFKRSNTTIVGIRSNYLKSRKFFFKYPVGLHICQCKDKKSSVSYSCSVTSIWQACVQVDYITRVSSSKSHHELLL